MNPGCYLFIEVPSVTKKMIIENLPLHLMPIIIQKISSKYFKERKFEIITCEIFGPSNKFHGIVNK